MSDFMCVHYIVCTFNIISLVLEGSLLFVFKSSGESITTLSLAGELVLTTSKLNILLVSSLFFDGISVDMIFVVSLVVSSSLDTHSGSSSELILSSSELILSSSTPNLHEELINF